MYLSIYLSISSSITFLISRTPSELIYFLHFTQYSREKRRVIDLIEELLQQKKIIDSLKIKNVIPTTKSRKPSLIIYAMTNSEKEIHSNVPEKSSDKRRRSTKVELYQNKMDLLYRGKSLLAGIFGDKNYPAAVPEVVNPGNKVEKRRDVNVREGSGGGVGSGLGGERGEMNGSREGDRGKSREGDRTINHNNSDRNNSGKNNNNSNSGRNNSANQDNQNNQSNSQYKKEGEQNENEEEEESNAFRTTMSGDINFLYIISFYFLCSI